MSIIGWRFSNLLRFFLYLNFLSWYFSFASKEKKSWENCMTFNTVRKKTKLYKLSPKTSFSETANKLKNTDRIKINVSEHPR